MLKTTRQLLLAFTILLGLFIILSTLPTLTNVVARVALWVWAKREEVGINLVAALIWASLAVLVVVFKKQLWNWLQSFFLSGEAKQKREEREYNEHLYLANIGAKIREDEPKWDTQFYTPLSATESYRLPGFHPEMILVSRRLRPKLFISTEEEEDASLSFIRGRKVDLIEILRKRERLVVLGAPGSGKSVAMRQLALLATEEAKRKSDAQRRLPLLVSMRSYTGVSPDGSPQDVLSFLRQYISDCMPRYGDFLTDDLEWYLAEAKLLILFDSLNEMPPDDYTERLKALKDFSIAWPRTRIVFTCRTFHHDSLFDIQEVVINPLTDKKIDLFIKNYLGSREGKRLHEELRTWDKRVSFKDCRTPYFLAMIVVLYDAGVSLPKTRGELFSTFVFGMVERMARNKGLAPQSTYSDIARRLCRLAFRMNEAKLLGTEIDRGWAIEAIGDEDADGTLQLAADAGLLDLTHVGKIRFAHHILQEYFACVALSGKFALSQDISTYLRDPWWEETVTLMAGLIEEPARLVQHILANDPRTSWDLWLAARCLASAGIPSDSAIHAAVCEAINSEISTDSVFRIARGIRALGELADERSVRLAAQWLYSRSPWVQETALSAVASSSIPAAREELLRFFRTRAPWIRIFPFLQYYLNFEERGPILRVLLLRLILLVATYVGFWIVGVAVATFATMATFRPGFNIVLSTLAFVMLVILLLYTGTMTRSFIQAQLGFSQWLALAVSTTLGICVLMFAYQVLRGVQEPKRAMQLIWVTFLVSASAWLIQHGTKAARVLRGPKPVRSEYQLSLAFSWGGLVLCLHLAASTLFTGYMLIAKRYVLYNMFFAATESSFPLATRLVIGGNLLLALAIIVLPMPAGVLATLAHINNVCKVLHLRRLEKVLTVPTRVFRDEWKRSLTSLDQIIRDQCIHAVVRARGIPLLSRVATPAEVLPLLVRMVLDISTPSEVRDSAWKAVDEIDNRWRRQTTDGSSEARLVNALLTFAIARKDLTDEAKATILEWAGTASTHSADPYIIASALLKDDSNSKRAAEMLSLATLAEPDNLGIFWQRADALFASEDYTSALADLTKIISTYDVRSYDWGPTPFGELSATLTMIVLRPILRSENVSKLPSFAQGALRKWFFYLLVGRSSRLERNAYFVAALEYDDEAVQLLPDLAVVYRNRADNLIKLDRFEEAARDLSKAAALEPDHPMLSRRYWAFYQYQGQTEKALESILRTIRKHPTLDNWYFELAVSLLALGNNEGTLQAFRLGTMFRPARDEIHEIRRLLRQRIPKSIDNETLGEIERILHHQ